MGQKQSPAIAGTALTPADCSSPPGTSRAGRGNRSSARSRRGNDCLEQCAGLVHLAQALQQQPVTAARLLARIIAGQRFEFDGGLVQIAHALAAAGVEHVALGGLEVGDGLAQPVQRVADALVVLQPEQRAGQPHQQRRVVGMRALPARSRRACAPRRSACPRTAPRRVSCGSPPCPSGAARRSPRGFPSPDRSPGPGRMRLRARRGYACMSGRISEKK